MILGVGATVFSQTYWTHSREIPMHKVYRAGHKQHLIYYYINILNTTVYV